MEGVHALNLNDIFLDENITNLLRWNFITFVHECIFHKSSACTQAGHRDLGMQEHQSSLQSIFTAS